MDFLKQRLIGAIFVLSMAVIIVPSVFDGDHGQAIAQQTTASAADYQNTLTQQQLAVASTETAVPTTRYVDHTNATAWSVRLGAFSDSDTARNLEQKLQGNGYKVYVQVLPSSKLYGVFVGPELVEDNAQIVLEQLHTQLDLNGIVVPYDPYLYVQNS